MMVIRIFLNSTEIEILNFTRKNLVKVFLKEAFMYLGPS